MTNIKKLILARKISNLSKSLKLLFMKTNFLEIFLRVYEANLDCWFLPRRFRGYFLGCASEILGKIVHIKKFPAPWVSTKCKEIQILKENTQTCSYFFTFFYVIRKIRTKFLKNSVWIYLETKFRDLSYLAVPLTSTIKNESF